MVERAKNFIQDNLPAIFTSLVLGLFFFVPIFKFQSLYWGTPALQFIPWRIFAFEEISSGRIAFFNPYNGMYAPLLANFQSALFYPPGWILFVLGFIGGNSTIAWGFGVLNYLHMAWAALGMMFLARELGISKFGQTISCVVFACSQVIISRQGFISMIWTIAWFPWFIFFIEKHRHSNLSKINRGVVVCVGLLLLAGHAQWAAYQLFFGAAWWCWRFFTDIKKWDLVVKKSLYLVRDVALGIGLACVQLMPTAELLFNSQRASSVDYELAMTYSFWPWRLLTLFLPNIYGSPGQGNYWGYGAYWEDAFYFGVLPAILLLFSIRALFRRKENDSESFHLALFLWGIALIAILLAMGKNTPVFPFLYRHIPGFDMFQAPARLMLLAVFCFALLAGLGSRYWKKPEGKSLYWTRLGTAGGAAIVVTSFVIGRLGIVEKKSIPDAFLTLGAFLLLFGVLSLTIGVKGGMKNAWILITFFSLAVDVHIANKGIIPWIDAAIFQTNQIKHEEGFVYYPEQDLYNIKFNKFLKFSDFRNIDVHHELRSNFIPDINLIDHIPVLNNFDPLLPARYVDFMNFLEELPDEDQKAWLQDLGVSVRGRSDEQNEAIFETLQTDLKPIAWTSCAVYSSDNNEIFLKLNEQILAQNDVDNSQTRCAIVSQKSNLAEIPVPDANQTIKIYSATPQKVELDINASVQGWLTFRRSWYPGWKIKIDEGEAQKPVLTDGNFLGIEVPAGEHRVELFYDPITFRIGLFISIISFGIIGFNDALRMRDRF